ncbi:VOC family protein, partial [Leptospira interrogans serovar Pomona]|nr:VOC family protein [Leptospira interrogans serovar Pomona]
MRPFKILGIQQIAVGGEDKQRLETFWVDLLVLEKTGTFKSEKENVDEDILRMGKGAYAVEVDIMQPIDSNKSPKVHEPKLNHIG